MILLYSGNEVLKMKYDPKNEYVVDIRNPEIIKRIDRSRKLYLTFSKKWKRKLDLSKPETIRRAYEDAKKKGIFREAQKIRELIFGKKIYFYGVSYLWDACVNYCKYCPGSIPNRKKAISQGKEYPLRELTVKQAVADTKAVMKDGHTHICYLSGSAPGREELPKKLVPYLIEFDKLGLNEIILNIEPPTEEGFEMIRKAVKNTPLQFRVFQETYNRRTYKKMHGTKGPKADYDFRRQSQARAIEAGIDNVGLGALFGLHRFPIEEIEGLRKHAEELENKYGVIPVRVCLPSANELQNIGVKIPYLLERGKYGKKRIIKKSYYELFNELMYALARLAMPEINIVSSERDRPAMLKILDKYATCTTLNVHPGVGDNAGIFKDVGCSGCEKTHFEQATTFPRNPKETLNEMKKRGYEPVFY